MQTFLPLPSFTESAKVLDYRRLGKQRVEAWQILNVILNPNPIWINVRIKGKLQPKLKKVAWINHPATQMWKNHPNALCLYGIKICEEWISRGFNDTLLSRFKIEFKRFNGEEIKIPAFVTDDIFNSSHRASLLFKDYGYYSQFSWSEEPKIEYFWPSKVV